MLPQFSGNSSILAHRRSEVNSVSAFSWVSVRPGEDVDLPRGSRVRPRVMLVCKYLAMTSSRSFTSWLPMCGSSSGISANGLGSSWAYGIRRRYRKPTFHKRIDVWVSILQTYQCVSIDTTNVSMCEYWYYKRINVWVLILQTYRCVSIDTANIKILALSNYSAVSNELYVFLIIRPGGFSDFSPTCM